MRRLRLAALATAALGAVVPPAGAATWTASAGLAGGRVLRLAVDPEAPAHAVAVVERLDGAEPRARLYETLDAGRSWTAGASATAGGNPLDASTSVAVAGGAVWVSDFSSSGPCRAATAAGPFACAPVGGPFTALTAVPGQPGALLAVGSALVRSTDGGATWQVVPGLAPNRLIAADAAAPGALYGTTDSRVLRSVDGGLVWTTVVQGSPCLPDDGAASTPGLLVDPSLAGRLYARTPAALCRSDDGGVSWTPVVWPAAGLGEPPFDAPPPGTGITAAGVLVAGSPAGAHRSTDGGVSWVRVADLGGRVVGPIAAAGATVYAGTADRGVFVSEDGGVSWRHASAGLPETPLERALFLITPGTDVVYGSLGSEVVRSDDGGAAWIARHGDPATNLDLLAVDPVDGTLYAYASAAGARSRLVASTDGGLTFATLAQGPPFTRLPQLLHVSRSGPRVLTALSEADRRLWRSTDDGATWRPAGPLRGFDDLAFDAADPRRIAALVRVPGGLVLYVTRNGGASWRRAVGGNANDIVEADPATGGVLWLVQQGGLLRRSRDGGRRFGRQPFALPVRTLAAAGRNLIGSFGAPAFARPGLFRSLPRDMLAASTDRGRSWTIVDGPPAARLGATAGRSLLLAEGPAGTVLRSPLPVATVRLLRPPRILGRARSGQTLRCQPARLSGRVLASTTAVGIPGSGPVGGATYRVPRAPGFAYACQTLARTPVGLVIASSAVVSVPGSIGGGAAGGEQDG